ncbi:hypothetical protein KJ359_002660 [Pestalotiopsis sp. 9143b]|nr:hypothetical protein KJ359_002660 [Pestalotiopsis sp. 9143b]
MAKFSNLTPELVNEILGYVYLDDLQSFILSSGTSKQFHAVVHGILNLNKRLPVEETAESEDNRALCVESDKTYDFLGERFLPFFSVTDCLLQDEDNEAIGAIHGDYMQPFKLCPWAQDAGLRSAFSRADASWRSLSVMAPGHQPITRLEIVRSYTGDEDEGIADNTQVHVLELPNGKEVLTIGLVYDLLLDANVHFDNETTDCILYENRRLIDYESFTRYGGSIRSDLDQTTKKDQHSAVLQVEGATITEDTDLPSWVVRHDWEPTHLGSRYSLKKLLE